jgi:hypothetical protein
MSRRQRADRHFRQATVAGGGLNSELIVQLETYIRQGRSSAFTISADRSLVILELQDQVLLMVAP